MQFHISRFIFSFSLHMPTSVIFSFCRPTIPLTMISVKTLHAAVLLAFVVCTSEASITWCGMSDNGDSNLRIFPSCTCQELACIQASKMCVDVYSYVWNDGVEVCSKCVAVCNDMAKSVLDILDCQDRARAAAHHCLMKQYSICFDIAKLVLNFHNYYAK